jgi:hypothetical protein
MHVAEHALFATRMLSISFDDVAGLNEDLARLIIGHERSAPADPSAGDAALFEDFARDPDRFNLLDVEPAYPCVARLRRMYLDGLSRWLRAEGVRGDLAVDMELFPNCARRHEFTLIHNHGAEVVGVYYVRTPGAPPAGKRGFGDDGYDYFLDDGALVLHDPRFNANLGSLRRDDYVKMFPAPGQMLIFPGYLWHSVLPHGGTDPRLSVAANFKIHPAEAGRRHTFPLHLGASQPSLSPGELE